MRTPPRRQPRHSLAVGGAALAPAFSLMSLKAQLYQTLQQLTKVNTCGCGLLRHKAVLHQIEFLKRITISNAIVFKPEFLFFYSNSLVP